MRSLLIWLFKSKTNSFIQWPSMYSFRPNFAALRLLKFAFIYIKWIKIEIWEISGRGNWVGQLDGIIKWNYPKTMFWKRNWNISLKLLVVTIDMMIYSKPFSYISDFTLQDLRLNLSQKTPFWTLNTHISRSRILER